MNARTMTGYAVFSLAVAIAGIIWFGSEPAIVFGFLIMSVVYNVGATIVRRLDRIERRLESEVHRA